MPPWESGSPGVFESLKKRRKGVYRAVYRCRPNCWASSTWCTAFGRRSGAARRRPALALEPHDGRPAGAGGHQAGQKA